MKKKKDVIAEMWQQTPRNGKVYFVGKLDGGAKVRMLPIKGKLTGYGAQVWELFIDK